MVVIFATAAVVFGVGQMFLPPPEWTRAVPQPPSTIAPFPAPSRAPAANATPEPAPEPEKAPAPTPEPAPVPAPTTSAPAPSSAPAAEASRRSVEKSKPTDKEIARAAWRKNLPDVTADASKASILIPIRGSTEGASWRPLDNPKGVLVILPKAESMISMELYKIRRDGFSNLWIKHDAQQGTSLRVMLGDAANPAVEIQDDFVRVTVQKTGPAPAN
ncbi:MAG TPA: hypothetical protein VMU50_17490 [Polyangia bacterium]|nr:hypothetical protein [Polyangia bacterium]